MDTNELITRLTADLKPVRPLRPPWARAGLWLALALPCVAALVWGKLNVDASRAAGDARFMVQEAATLATALMAAYAAFASAVPGFNRRLLLLPLAPLSLWLVSIGQGCLQDWIQRGSDGLILRPDWDCLLLAALIGAVPAAAIVAMLRAAPSLRPRATLTLAALAVAALANSGLQLAHLHDASIMVLTWHLGGAAVFSALGGSFGERVLAQPDRLLAR
jgi:hypothetical protein